MSVVRTIAADRSAFAALAAAFARGLRAGDVVALSGDLGAGKTTFVAAAVAELSPAAEVSSPTFIFWQHYDGTPPVEHLDFYRVDDATDVRELGLEDALGPGGIAFVEWPERIPGVIPAHAIRVRIEGSGSEPRRLEIERP